jgi:diguanylate cyclase (GGDEF)-like protein
MARAYGSVAIALHGRIKGTAAGKRWSMGYHLAADLRRWWRETPAVSSLAVLRWTNGSLYLFGGLTLVPGNLLLASPGVDHTGIAIVTAGVIAIGVLIFAAGHLIPRRGYHALGVLATLIISALVLMGDGRASSVALGAPYIFVVVNSMLVFALREALAEVLLAEVACAVAMSHSGVSAGAIVIVEGCTIGMAAVAAWLARLADAAEEDPLTLLPNRRGFTRRLDTALQEAAYGGGLAVALLDVDWFKEVNDLHGHPRGDQTLIACAQAWARLMPPGACLSRYGGDEFALLLPDQPLGRAADLADELRAATPRGLTASAGVAGWEPGDSGSVLMGRADVALYQAKTSGRDRTAVYGDPDRAASALEAAIDRDELCLLYQPVIDLRSGDLIGHEALVRWQRPDRGLLGPAEFIPDAERTGAIHSLGSWLLREACAFVAERDDVSLTVGVNASPVELRNPEYAATVRDCLAAHAVPGRRIVLEVTEGAFDGDDEPILANLCALRELGVRVAIDDFGAGYSSLRRLESLPIDVLKVDGALVSSVREDQEEAPVLEAIAAMGHALGLRLVAEHVETPHQADVLRRLGYDGAQGYLFGRPSPVS